MSHAFSHFIHFMKPKRCVRSAGSKTRYGNEKGMKKEKKESETDLLAALVHPVLLLNVSSSPETGQASTRVPIILRF